MSKLALKTNSISYLGFESAHIKKSMLKMCGSFAVSANNFFQGGTKRTEMKMGHGVRLEIDDVLVLDGWIDRMPVEFGENYDRLEVWGRDVTGDLVDCSYDFAPNEWKNQTVKNLIANLCSPFGVTSVVDSTATTECNTTIETYKANEGVAVSELIKRLCMEVGVIPICYGDGLLTITKTSAEQSNDPLVVGNNVIAGRLEQSNVNRFSNYHVKGVGVGSDNKSLADFVECDGEFSDSIIGRTRPLTLFSDGPTTIDRCRKRAIMEARLRAGLSRALVYNADGWVQSNGKPWQINRTVQVKDDFSGIDATKLIASIDFIYDEENKGDVAKIAVVDKGTFSLSEDAINIKTGFDV